MEASTAVDRGGRKYTEADFAFMREIGQRIRDRRIALGFSGPTEFARSIGEDDQFGSYLSQVERGALFPSFRRLLQIAAGLKTTTAHLLGDADAVVMDSDEDAAWRAGYSQALLDAQAIIAALRSGEVTPE